MAATTLPAGMTATERAAWTWLLAQGPAVADLTFQRRGTPDFVAADGRGWEVKLARQRVVVIYPSQLATLRARRAPTTLLLWLPGGTAPAAAVPAARLRTLPLEVGRYRIVGLEARAPTLRLPDDLHRLVRIAAGARGQSDHAWIVAAVRGALLHQARRRDGRALAAALDDGRPTGS